MAGRLFKLIILNILLLVLIPGLILNGYSQSQMPVKVMTAGSLLVPFRAIEEAYEKAHPEVDVLIEGHGSIQVIRHVTEVPLLSGEAIADIVAVADYSLIPKMMYHTLIPGENRAYANWCLQFATNSLGLAYTSQSKYVGEINLDNWYEILSRPEVKVGMSDPRFDSCGYRALIAMKLAELFYGKEGLSSSIMGNFSYPLQVEENNNSYTIFVPEILEPERLVMRNSSVTLVFPLQSGDLDYAFEYKSVAEQHGLNFLELPPEINLSSDSYKTLCPNIKVKLAFKRFASVNPDFDILPIIYGLTVPANASHPEEAIRLIEFILGPEGQEILLKARQVTINPPLVDNPGNLPVDLIPLVIREK
jgi:molybdate/tungstate transport system substrate-binding protein